ncbi:hypothetical protein AZE42_02720 [Rhizopogon vesiculosus]|uniref:Uncharacterized protein n=1 Tax=Rhizopogon vesiculosus TaxID=180088 RepID=A0A1J8QJ15_9AGAM|nr:hypothetical protein AZE42_02720 [Rhizopogon vesiculosus]
MQHIITRHSSLSLIPRRSQHCQVVRYLPRTLSNQVSALPSSIS